MIPLWWPVQRMHDSMLIYTCHQDCPLGHFKLIIHTKRLILDSVSYTSHLVFLTDPSWWWGCLVGTSIWDWGECERSGAPKSCLSETKPWYIHQVELQKNIDSCLFLLCTEFLFYSTKILPMQREWLHHLSHNFKPTYNIWFWLCTSFNRCICFVLADIVFWHHPGKTVMVDWA